LNIDAELSELYDRAISYVEKRDSPAIVDSYALAMEDIPKFIDSLSDFGTSYSIRLAEAVGKTMRDLIAEDYSSNKTAQPANIRLTTVDKKYPFHSVGFYPVSTDS
jgi:hypothetical protein